MAKRLPPALERATRNREVTAARWRAHRKECHPCNMAFHTTGPSLACDPGFRLWQAATRAANAETHQRQREAVWAAAQQTLL